MNNYKKYLKYKNKYIQLKNQIGGILTEQELSNIETQINNNVDINETNLYFFYVQKLKQKKIDELKAYVSKNRKIGMKIMLIVGAIPSQQEKFNIPKNFVPVYIEKDFKFEHYNGQDLKENFKSIRKNMLTKSDSESNSFDKYPLILGDIFSEEFKNIDVKYDLIIFDDDVCKFIDFNKDNLTSLFNLTVDNSSIVSIDGYDRYDNTISILEFNKKILDKNMQKYNNNIPVDNIIKILCYWIIFILDINDIKNNDTYDNKCQFLLSLYKKVIDPNPKLTVLFYNKNIYQTNSSSNLYLYFVNTNRSNDSNYPNVTNDPNKLFIGMRQDPNNPKNLNNPKNPKNFNKLLYLTTEEILFYEIIIPYYKDNLGVTNAIDIPFLGISLKFPNYMFDVESYRFDNTRDTGIFGLTIYKIQNIPQQILDRAFQTSMWLQYYHSFTSKIHYFKYEKNAVNKFIQNNNLVTLMVDANQITKDKIKISINYERILKHYGIELESESEFP
jgi:hypothetical protein